MPIFHKHKCIFIHIPKSAGTSINAALGIGKEGIQSLFGKITEEEKLQFGLNHSYWHHCPVSVLKQFIPEDTFTGYFKFTFIRNPWDRLVSLYFYHKRIRHLQDTTTFNEWVLSHKIPAYLLTPQLDYITNNKGSTVVDFIGRFENLEKDWTYIAKKIGTNMKLIPANITKRKHYSLYYTEETKKIVTEIFKKDIEAFGYKFEIATFFENKIFNIKNFILFNAEHAVLKIKSLSKNRFPNLHLKLKKLKREL